MLAPWRWPAAAILALVCTPRHAVPEALHWGAAPSIVLPAVWWITMALYLALLEASMA